MDTYLLYPIHALFYCRFVNKMGGHIWVESEGQGKGTTVTFVVRLSLPEKTEELKKALKTAGQKAAAASAAASSAGADDDKAVDFTGLKVIVCDDNQ